MVKILMLFFTKNISKIKIEGKVRTMMFKRIVKFFLVLPSLKIILTASFVS